MLPKSVRLKKRTDFSKVMRGGAAVRGGFIDVKSAKNNRPEHRFGFIVSLNIAKKAVVRNRIRRQMAEAVRTSLREVGTGQDLVFIARPQIIRKRREEIQEEIKKLLKGIKAYHG